MTAVHTVHAIRAVPCILQFQEFGKGERCASCREPYCRAVIPSVREVQTLWDVSHCRDTALGEAAAREAEIVAGVNARTMILTG